MVDSSTLVFVAFGVLAVCVILALFILSSDWLAPVLRSASKSVGRTLSRCCARGFSSHKSSKHTSGDDDVEDAELSDDASSVLAMLDMPTMVVDNDNEVIRASSQAYTLGLVTDDAVSQSRVLQAINEVRQQGGSKRFTLVTHTPAQYVAVQEHDVVQDAVPASSVSSDLQLEHSQRYDRSSLETMHDASVVTRRNWLTVTVGRINDGLVVVLIEDTSTAHRFEQTRKDFITNVSEQLMRSTKTITQLSQILQHDRVSAERIEAVARLADRSAHHLHHMVEDLLLLMRAQHPIDVEHADTVNVGKQVALVAKDITPIAAAAHVRLVVNFDDCLLSYGDASQIRAALRKVVENAVAYSSEGSMVALQAARSEDGCYAVIRVVDRGVGIPLEDQPRIFERFYRSHNQSEKTAQGVGLGLAIAKHVALTHHGSITLWSRPGKGTTVNFALPLIDSEISAQRVEFV